MGADEIFAAVIAAMDVAEGFAGPTGLDYVRLMSRIADEARVRERNAILSHLEEITAREWKIVEHKWGEAEDIVVTEKRLGRYTSATARDKMNDRFPDYGFKFVSSHGFGGYWVKKNGDTAQCVPA